MKRHLRSYENKNLLGRIIFISIIIVFLFYFLFSFGFGLLIDTSVFIASLTQKKTESNNSLTVKNDFYGSVDINDIPTATNSASIYVNGSVLNFDKMEFFLNGSKFKEVKVNNSSNFSEEVKDLIVGENQIYIVAKTKDNKHIKETKKFSVLYKAEKPKLEIKEPSDNFKTNKNEIKIIGVTDKEVFIKVNGLPVVVDTQSTFQTVIRLKDGENKIEIIAEDIAGNMEKKTLTVVYQKDE